MEKNITTYEDIVVDQERKILFCGVPKAATTIWKRMFLKMEFPRFANVPLDEVRSGKDGKLSTTKGQDLKTLKDFTIEERKQIFDTYYKVSLFLSADCLLRRFLNSPKQFGLNSLSTQLIYVLFSFWWWGHHLSGFCRLFEISRIDSLTHFSMAK